METLPNDRDALKAIIEQLLEKIQRLETENAQLRRRLEIDSTNSHKPPSSDGYRKKTTQPGLPKKPRGLKGGQPRHKGRTLKPVETPDHIEMHLPQECQCCGRPLVSEEEYEVVPIRQVFDLPEPKLEVTEHRLGQITCCGVEQRGEYPREVKTFVQYGTRVRALIVILSVDHKMPLERISQLFIDIYGYELNSQTIIETLERGYQWSAPLEEQVKAELPEAEVVHFDETGIRVKSQLYWLHTASNFHSTHLFLHKTRGTEALLSAESVLTDFRGIAVHDCWAPYFTFNQARHSLCGAHLLRELHGLREAGCLWAEEMHEFLLDLYNAPHPMAAEAIRQPYQIILEQAEREEPPPRRGKRGRPKQSRGRNLLNRLQNHQESVLAFALEAGVPFTNNQAERDLRPSQVKLKICGGFRTVEGGMVYARLQALISTLRKRNLNVFFHLRELFSLRLALLASIG